MNSSPGCVGGEEALLCEEDVVWWRSACVNSSMGRRFKQTYGGGRQTVVSVILCRDINHFER